MTAIESQGRILHEISQSAGGRITRDNSEVIEKPVDEDENPETMSRKDVLWTPITGSDNILEWSVFAANKPIQTLPTSAYRVKLNPYENGEYIMSQGMHGVDEGLISVQHAFKKLLVRRQTV